MSAQRVGVLVECDGTTGPPVAPCPDNASFMDARTAAEIRATLKGDGWDVGLPGGIDRCPRCKG